MKTQIAQISFTTEITKDGSPTLKASESGETMHHSGGAASETKYIYKDVLEWAYGCQAQLKTCVVGLGLAYIEISWAQVLVRLSLKPTAHLYLTSFETNEDLKKNFLNFINEDGEVNSVYAEINRHLHAQADLSQVKEVLKQNVELESLRGDLITCAPKDKKWNLICYDAFSSKTTEALWRKEFLDQFIREHCEEDCVFTTYACTGNLKKTLLQNRFSLIERKGFSGKRESTLALRGGFIQEYSQRSFQTS